MRLHKFLIYLGVFIFLGGLVGGCKPKVDMMEKAEHMFIKMVDKSAKKLDLTEDQKSKLEGLKAEIRKNFEEGRKEKQESVRKIKDEAMKENADIGRMTGYFQQITRAEAERINRAFDLLLGFQGNLNDAQKRKLTQKISDWVKKWD